MIHLKGKFKIYCSSKNDSIKKYLHSSHGNIFGFWHLPPSQSTTKSESVFGTNSDFGRCAASSRLKKKVEIYHEFFKID